MFILKVKVKLGVKTCTIYRCTQKHTHDWRPWGSEMKRGHTMTTSLELLSSRMGGTTCQWTASCCRWQAQPGWRLQGARLLDHHYEKNWLAGAMCRLQVMSILKCAAVGKYIFWHLASLLSWGWQEHLVKMLVSSFQIIALYKENLCFILQPQLRNVTSC